MVFRRGRERHRGPSCRVTVLLGLGLTWLATPSVARAASWPADAGGNASIAGARPATGDPAGGPACAFDSWVARAPHSPEVDYYVATSDAAPDYRVFDEYETGGPVCGIRFWGFDFHYDGVLWEECVEDPMTFEIAFFEDGGGLPGAEICSYIVDAVAVPTGLLYFPNLPLEMSEYSAVLSPCCPLESGWVSIRGISVGGDPVDCWFAWMSGSGGGGSSVQSAGGAYYGVLFDRAVCLASGEGACCLPEPPYCTVDSEVNCIAAGGAFLGDGSPCDFTDCNENGIPDACDIAGGTSKDDDSDGIPDECESLLFEDPTSGEIFVDGTVSGTYANTVVPDGLYEAITELLSGGPPPSRYSYLEHKWVFDVQGGAAVTFFLAGYHSSSTDDDDFVFAYALDDVNYTDMLTLVKTVDDGSYQSVNLPAGTWGTVYVRVLDTDQTAGDTALDSVYVDHMFIRSATMLGDLDEDGYLDHADFALLVDCLTGPGSSYPPACQLADMDRDNDVDLADFAGFQEQYTGHDMAPPDAPTGLTAMAGGASVSLDWNDSGAFDLAGYNVYRATDSGGPYELVNAGLVPASAYVDTGVADEVTYYYVVTAVDINENESVVSDEASATPQASAFMHIASLVLSVDDQGGGNRFGVATVTVLDGSDLPVVGADVTGTFAGDFTGTLVETTNADGVAVLIIGPTNGRTFFSFCVDDITHATLARDFYADVQTCETYP